MKIRVYKCGKEVVTIFDAKQERVLQIIDDIIDSELVKNESLISYIGREMPSFRVRCARTFGSLKAALEAYGYYENESRKEISFERLYDFVADCFRINEVGHVFVDFELLFEKADELIAMGYDVTSLKIMNDVTEYLALDRIEAVMIHYNENAHEIIDAKTRRYPENQLEFLIRKHYKSRKNLYRMYRINIGMLTSKSVENRRELIELGTEFERLVGEVLATVHGCNVESQLYIEDCRPDFIVGRNWIDAKLSRSTALSSYCSTIEKYRKHTDYLTIIYALDDTTADDKRATFVHISEYYPYISSEIRREIDVFIRKASRVKFGGGDVN